MEIRVLIEMNRLRMSVLNQENNTSSSVPSISDLGIETQHSIFNWMFPGRLVDETAMR
jgi:hypothetical protein